MVCFYACVSLLNVDEIGYLPITIGGVSLLFQLVNARYEKDAMIIRRHNGKIRWINKFVIFEKSTPIGVADRWAL